MILERNEIEKIILSVPFVMIDTLKQADEKRVFRVSLLQELIIFL